MQRYDEAYVDLVSKLNSAFDKKKDDNRIGLNFFDKIYKEKQKFIEDMPYEEIRKIAMKVRSGIKDIGYLTDKEQMMIMSVKEGKKTKCKQVVYRLMGKVDTDAIMKRYVELLHMEPAFNTFYIYKGMKEPVRVTCENKETVFPIHDIRNLSADKKNILIKNILAAKMRHEFDIETEKAINIDGYLTRDDELVVIISIYPYVSYSMGIRGMIYKIFEGMEPQSSNVPVVDEKIALRIKEELKGKSLDYWKELLLPLGKSMTIPGEGKRDGGGIRRAAGKSFIYKELGGELVTNLKKFCQKNRTSLKSVFLYAWGDMMGRYHDENTPLMLMIQKGERMNQFPVKIVRSETLSDNLHGIDKQINEASDYSNCTIEDMQELLGITYTEYFRMVHNFVEFSELDNIDSGSTDIAAINGVTEDDTDINLFISYHMYDNSIGINYSAKSDIVEIVLENLHELFVKELSLLMNQSSQKFDKSLFIKVSDTDEERLYKLQVAQIALYLKESGIFESFTVDEIMKLAEACRLTTYLSNDVVVSEKTKISNLYILGDGKIEESMTALDGIVKTLRIIKKGSVFGVESMMKDNEAKTTYSIVSSQAKIVEIKQEIIEEVFKRKPEGLKQLLENEMDQKAKLQRLWTME